MKQGLFRLMMTLMKMNVKIVLPVLMRLRGYIKFTNLLFILMKMRYGLLLFPQTYPNPKIKILSFLPPKEKRLKICLRTLKNLRIIS